jgi:hypothetical protein
MLNISKNDFCKNIFIIKMENTMRLRAKDISDWLKLKNLIITLYPKKNVLKVLQLIYI